MNIERFLDKDQKTLAILFTALMIGVVLVIVAFSQIADKRSKRTKEAVMESVKKCVLTEYFVVLDEEAKPVRVYDCSRKQ